MHFVCVFNATKLKTTETGITKKLIIKYFKKHESGFYIKKDKRVTTLITYHDSYDKDSCCHIKYFVWLYCTNRNFPRSFTPCILFVLDNILG